MRLRQLLFVACAGLMLVPGMSPAIALAVGAALALTVGTPFPALGTRGASILLKASVVGLGLGMSLDMLARAGAPGLLYTAAVVAGTLAVGLWLGRVLGLPRETTLLIASGTGICGGSAIAAVGAAVRARPESMSAALATVFVLNAVALDLFPAIGALLGMAEPRFGVWAALAIHDTSSVVGAAAIYGSTALAVATVMKLARALWIVPLTVAAATVGRGDRQGRVDRKRAAIEGMPWFVVAFVLAVIIRSMSPDAALPALDLVANTARVGLVVTLFLIGTSLTRATLARVGGRPFILGVLLWILVAGATLVAVMAPVPV